MSSPITVNTFTVVIILILLLFLYRSSASKKKLVSQPVPVSQKIIENLDPRFAFQSSESAEGDLEPNLKGESVLDPRFAFMQHEHLKDRSDDPRFLPLELYMSDFNNKGTKDRVEKLSAPNLAWASGMSDEMGNKSAFITNEVQEDAFLMKTHPELF